MAFNAREFSIIGLADFKISNMMYKAGWKVKTKRDTIFLNPVVLFE